MTRRRSLARLWRRLRRPSLPRLAVASLAFHVIVLTLSAWLVGPEWVPPAPPPPLVVELPPAEPGRPLARPEAPAPAPPAPAARSEPRTPPRATPALPAPRPAPAPTTPPPAPLPVTPPPPPTVARAPEPPPLPSAPAAPPLPPAPAPAGTPPAPGPSAVARAVPEGPPPAPPQTTPSPGPTDSPLIGRGFSLLRPKLDVPPLPRLPGSGGTRTEGDGAGEAGRERDGQAAIPLNQPPDADHAAYFLKVKKAIEDHWSYPRAAAEKGQSGQLMLEFVIKKDGNVLVELVRSSGIEILDRYAVNAVKLSAPFPPIPERLADSLRISASFTYILDHGFRVFGLR